MHEEAWNAYPYCKTVLSNPGYMKVRILMDVVDVNKFVIITSAYIFLVMLLKHDFCYRFQSVKSF